MEPVMASARSSLLNMLTRVLMWLLFRSRQHPTRYRESMARLDLKSRRPPPPHITTEIVDLPVPGCWVRNAQAPAGRVILYLHGGAFIMRLPHGHTAMVARLCTETGHSAFMAYYRLAPEHPFPIPAEDCLSAYRSLLDEGYQARDIAVMGDSAGGNLALALLHLVRRAGLPMPGSVAALSPITDFAQISATWRLNRWRDPMYRVQGFVNPVEWYLQGASPVDPVASPYYGDFSGFPPLLFIVGGLEALLDDSIGMARKAVESGIPAKVHLWKGMPHVFLLQESLPEARLAIREIAAWLAALPPGGAGLYRGCVEVFDVQPLTARLRRETNDVFLDAPTPTTALSAESRA
jgi:monoterpene epsilon-lactone hydrolase